MLIELPGPNPPNAFGDFTKDGILLWGTGSEGKRYGVDGDTVVIEGTSESGADPGLRFLFQGDLKTLIYGDSLDSSIQLRRMR